MNSPEYHTYCKSDNRHHLRMVDGEGKILLATGSFASQKECEAALESIRTNSQSDDLFDRVEVEPDRFCFHLMQPDGIVVGTSPHFDSHLNRERAIAQVRYFGADARLRELDEPPS